MSLRDAKRMLQWNVVMEALVEANVGAELVEMVKRARSIDEIIHAMAGTLLGGADVKQAKNYVKVEMVGMAAPFERAYVELVRSGGRTSHELRDMLRDRLISVRRLLAEGRPNDALREGMIEGIDGVLAMELP